jgi:hypothetical protein
MPSEGRWLVLIHQIPPKPTYFRVRIWRRLQRLGAVTIKNSVYALPKNDQAHEDLQWVLREIIEGGGDASLCEARFVGGLSDAQVEALFSAARGADYAQLAGEARELGDSIPDGEMSAERLADGTTRLARLRRRLTEIVAIDFFDAPGREAADGLIAGIEGRLRRAPEKNCATTGRGKREDLCGRTWVTRKGVHIDRMASAWLIRRFIDAEAHFKFVPAKGYKPRAREIRFDMFEAEFTHEGDHCTFEVFLDRLRLSDPALRAIADIVHDIDLKDSKFARPETLGIERLVAGLAMIHEDDDPRIANAATVFDGLYEYFHRKRR